MSFIQMQASDSSDRQPSPGLSSNNPFRNRTISPTGSLPQSPVTNAFQIPSSAPERPTSRNPFLDQDEKKDQTLVNVRPASPLKDSNMSRRASPPKPAQPTLTGHAAELFDNLTLNDGSATNGYSSLRDPPPSYSSAFPPRRPERERADNLPPRTKASMSGHHPSRSDENRRGPSNGVQRPRRAGTDNLDIFADPPTEGRPRPRMRRNSDSSIASKILSPEEERRRRDRHRRERESRHKNGSGRDGRSKKPVRNLDLIDSLDVTSIYGKGLFHHDGPFDACNPDRNRKGSRRAPMEAFAKDSKNNVLGGSGPVNKNIDFNQFHGRGEEGFTDYSTSGNANPNAVEPAVFEPNAAAYTRPRGAPGDRSGIDRASTFNASAGLDKMYGEETLGLGASTFLEGTPAPRAAIQRHDSEEKVAGVNGMNGGGLGRKRSLAQKIRGISGSTRHRPNQNGRISSPERVDQNSPPATSQGETLSAGGMPRINQTNQTNPFFKDYRGGNADHDAEYDRKGQRIAAAQQKQQEQLDKAAAQANGAGRLERRGSIGGGEEEFYASAAAARHRATSSPKRPAGSGGEKVVGGGTGIGIESRLLQRRVTNDGVSGTDGGNQLNNAGGGTVNGSSSGGGFLSRVKSLKGGKRGRPAEGSSKA